MKGENTVIGTQQGNSQNKQKLIISETQKSSKRRRTTQARGALHQLIVRFRKNSEQAKDPTAKALFRLASDILASLARLFKSYEETVEEDKAEPTIRS